ncbi:uncharacterized protein [Clytia hemisphaerica]|uniref:Uncharacterized protein n=1 Tax=Clytia hemisphaerica TaxID=252671 RepID=A0A7M5WUY8_9CNID
MENAGALDMSAKRLAGDAVLQSEREEEEIIDRLAAKVIGDSFREGLDTTAKRLSEEEVLQQSVSEKAEIVTTARRISDLVLEQSIREVETEIDMEAKLLASKILAHVINDEVGLAAANNMMDGYASMSDPYHSVDTTAKHHTSKEVQCVNNKIVIAAKKTSPSPIDVEGLNCDEELLNLTVKTIIDKVLKKVVEEDILNSINNTKKKGDDNVNAGDSVVQQDEVPLNQETPVGKSNITKENATALPPKQSQNSVDQDQTKSEESIPQNRESSEGESKSDTENATVSLGECSNSKESATATPKRSWTKVNPSQNTEEGLEYVVYDILKDVDRNEGFYCEDSTNARELEQRRAARQLKRALEVERLALSKSLETQMARRRSATMKVQRQAEEFQKRMEEIQEMDVNFENHPELYAAEAIIDEESDDSEPEIAETDDGGVYADVFQLVDMTPISTFGALPAPEEVNFTEWQTPISMFIDCYLYKREILRGRFPVKRMRYIKQKAAERRKRSKEERDAKKNNALCLADLRAEGEIIEDQCQMIDRERRIHLYTDKPKMAQNIQSNTGPVINETANVKRPSRWKRVKRAIRNCLKLRGHSRRRVSDDEIIDRKLKEVKRLLDGLSE